MSETAVAIRDNRQWQAMTPDQEQLVRDTICKGGTKDEVSLFLAIANRLRLDPFTRQIMAVKRWDSQLGRDVMTAQIGIDGMRFVCERDYPDYLGMDPPQWCGKDGVWRELWLDETQHPAAAKVTVYREGKRPFVGLATWSAYAQTKRDGSLTSFWKRMGPHMLAKCAEALARRSGFPVFTGVLLPEETGGSEGVEAIRTEQRLSSSAQHRLPSGSELPLPPDMPRVRAVRPVEMPPAPAPAPAPVVVEAEVVEPPDEDDPAELYACDHCERVFDTAKGLARHRATHKQEVQPIAQNVAQEATAPKPEATTPPAQPSAPQANGDPLTACEWCGRELPPRLLAEHLLTCKKNPANDPANGATLEEFVQVTRELRSLDKGAMERVLERAAGELSSGDPRDWSHEERAVAFQWMRQALSNAIDANAAKE